MADFNLPNEIWCKIFSYLPSTSKKNATATCKLWSTLIREDPKLSGCISISWYSMEKALEKCQWNWNNWPALKTLELKSHPLIFVEDSGYSREGILSTIEKLSLKHCPQSLEEVLFDVDLSSDVDTSHRLSSRGGELKRWCDCTHKCLATKRLDLTPIQTYGQSILKYQPYTDQIFGLGQKLDSIQKWNEYEANMKVLKRLKSMRHPQIRQFILAELEATNDFLLFIASPVFQSFRHLRDKITNWYAQGYVKVPNFEEYMLFGEFICELRCDYSMRKYLESLRSPLVNP